MVMAGECESNSLPGSPSTGFDSLIAFIRASRSFCRARSLPLLSNNKYKYSALRVHLIVKAYYWFTESTTARGHDILVHELENYQLKFDSQLNNLISTDRTEKKEYQYTMYSLIFLKEINAWMFKLP